MNCFHLPFNFAVRLSTKAENMAGLFKAQFTGEGDTQELKQGIDEVVEEDPHYDPHGLGSGEFYPL
jgi:hypothetical protein